MMINENTAKFIAGVIGSDQFVQASLYKANGLMAKTAKLKAHHEEAKKLAKKANVKPSALTVDLIEDATWNIDELLIGAQNAGLNELDKQITQYPMLFSRAKELKLIRTS